MRRCVTHIILNLCPVQDSGSLAVFKVTARDQLGHYQGPSGAFVTYYNISCSLCISTHLIPFYTTDKLLLQKLRREVTVKTGDRVMVLAVCNSPNGPLSLYQVSFNYFNTSKDIVRTKCDGRMDRQRGNCILSLQGA